MKVRRLVVVATSIVACLTVNTGAASATGEEDAWRLINSGKSEIRIDMAGVYGALERLPLLDTVGKTSACQPREKSISVYELYWQTWTNAFTGEIAYRWLGAGAAAVSTDCASSLHTTGQVSDYSATGDPPVVQGPPASQTAHAGPDDSMIHTYVSPSAWVVYYNLQSGYVRSTKTTIEVKVRASYTDKWTGQVMPMGCMATYTDVTPTPARPIVGPTSPATPCVT